MKRVADIAHGGRQLSRRMEGGIDIPPFLLPDLEEVKMEGRGEWAVMLSMGENNTTRGEEATW
jgi:hypothetical protein